MNCVNGFSWCGNTSGRGYCSDECRGDRELADETRRIDVALKEYDRRTADKPEAGDCASCGEEMPRRGCHKSKRDCGHHCNHSLTHDACCWCGKDFGDDK